MPLPKIKAFGKIETCHFKFPRQFVFFSSFSEGMLQRSPLDLWHKLHGMQLKPVTVVENIEPEIFKNDFYRTHTPVVIKNLSKEWPARTKWNWDYFKQVVGEKQVGVYNNVKSDAYTPINRADGYMKFGEYLDLIKKGPVELRIFLFNIFQHAPQLANDFTWPDHLDRKSVV